MLKERVSFWRNESAAIAPMYALALPMLVVMAGVGFDYGRIMALDSELQNAADHAAIAAATQLDGRSDAITRAQNAARNSFATASSAFVNETRFSTEDDDADGDTRPITSLSFRFFDGYADDAFGTETTAGEDAAVVEVTVNPRRVHYALTAIVDAIINASSDDAIGRAVAAVESATCKVPPLMVCAPWSDFPRDGSGDQPSDIGRGVRLEPGAQNGFWAPGTYGYLDIFGNGAAVLRDLLGSNGFQDACISNEGTVEASEGNKTSATNALNTRFDIYPTANGYDCQADGDFCPVENTRKDMVRKEEYTWKNQTAGDVPDRPDCDKNAVSTNGNPIPTIDVTVMDEDPRNFARPQGFSRDTCHNVGNCNVENSGHFGDGVWDRNAYANNYFAAYGQTIPANLQTRFEIYEWERDNGNLGPVLANPGDTVGEDCKPNGRCDYTWTNYCAYPSPINASAPTRSKDGRILTVAAVDCANSASNHVFPVFRWVDMFLVEPSLNRSTPNTHQQQIYGEVIGNAVRPGGGSGFQYYGKRKAVLIR